MRSAPSDRVSRVFARLARHPYVVLAVYAVLVPIAAIIAVGIPRSGGIEQLIVASDPDYVATQAFDKIFPEPKLVSLVLESDDPWSPASIARVERTVAALASVPHVKAFSPLDTLRRARPGAAVPEMQALASGTDFFRRHGLIGPHYMTVIASIDGRDNDVRSPPDRDATLAAIDRALDRAHVEPVRKVGSLYVQSWLEHQSAAGTGRALALAGVMLLLVTWFLYRSVRATLAIAISVGAAAGLAVAAGGAIGASFTIVSSLVPLSVVVTMLATLTYLHSRFVDQPDDMQLHDHQIDALRNKFLPVTASTLAAAMGFAALVVSNIRPVREMGIWTAIGIIISWVVAFTLFPALQLVLRAPTGRRVTVRRTVYDRVARVLPGLAFRHRWVFLAGALALCAISALAITGVPGMIRGMPIEVDALSNIDPHTSLARDLRWYRDHVMGLDLVSVWIHVPDARATDPEVLRAVDQLTTAIEAIPRVSAVTGPTTFLRLRSYFQGRGTTLPAGAAGFAPATEDIEQLLLTQPELRGFIDPSALSDIQLIVQFHGSTAASYTALVRDVGTSWDTVRARMPALDRARMTVTGDALLRGKVGASLVPTLAHSLLITVGFIFVVFLVVFRSGTERLLAMLPSLFAVLVAFFCMRVLGGSLDIATIIVATIVVGATENDQLHFFHHMHERAGAPLEDRLSYTLRVSGRAIVFATIVNATGFLALSTSSFPPLRRLGAVTAAAFVLAMLADFTVLLAALWIASRERPSAQGEVLGPRASGIGPTR